MTADLSNECSDSFEGVLREREKQVLRTAFRILGNWADAEDVSQEVFLRLHRRGLRFPSGAALGAWIYRVTVNLCIDRSRTYLDVGLTTSGDFAEGQKTVLGKVAGIDDDSSIFVVISLKVLD